MSKLLQVRSYDDSFLHCYISIRSLPNTMFQFAGHADQWTRVAEVLANEENMEIDFVDMNLGCPIDLVCEKGAGASLMLRERKLRDSLTGMLKVLPCPVTIKMRTGWNENNPIAHELVPKIQSWGIDGIGAFMVRIYEPDRSGATC